ncbi:hypothetical protein [Haloarcula sebkhae]|uniref:Uncharacterized protein n=2 Tax=Haloarcula sebkhae TaxID=932660 RepID=A0ACC6VL64_9EURY|nr:hypothetical protein [Haloarcula sebkhae]GGK84654.1 hypothetical protein GCM10009067_41040 [Haloarcula sebkhae]
MQNFELPLHLVANKAGDRVSLEAIAEAHRIYNGLEEGEYREEAPDLEVVTAQRLFAELNGATWEERQERIDTNRQIERVPKCLDIPLAFASGGNIDRAQWLLEDMIEQGILHEPSKQHLEFFEQADVMEKGFEQIAKAEAKRRQKEVMRNLRQNE